MVCIERIKRKKVGVQEKSSVLTLESLKQSTRYDIDLILDYLERLPDKLSFELKKKLDISGGFIDGDVEVSGSITENREPCCFV